jgi:hypothetical protein
MSTPNIIIQEVTDSKITLDMNGEIKEIANGFAELKQILQDNKAQNFQRANNIYNIGTINEANFGFVTGSKAFNEFLTRRLIEAIKDYSTPAHNFFEDMKNKPQNWETQGRYSNQATEIITNEDVGVLGSQLRKVVAIGKEATSPDKQNKYVQNCVLTVKRAVQLLNFAMISRLWDYKIKEGYSLSDEHCASCKGFFEDKFGYDIIENAKFLKTLLDIYDLQKFELPIPELDELKKHLAEGTEFMTACTKMNEKFNSLESSFSLLDCFESENQLAIVLGSLNFLVNYKMISIKSIDYFKVRNKSVRYLHRYSPIGNEGETKDRNIPMVNYEKIPVNTDAILLYKGSYQDSINLFPFLIDLNALSFETGAKVYFYNCLDTEGRLNFSCVEDNSEKRISKSDTLKSDDEDITLITKLMQDEKTRRMLKMDSLFFLFNRAKTAITGESKVEDSGNSF